MYGSQTDVVLDCDFTSGDHTVTEIKWFLDGDKQIYQWLPKTNVPAQALGKLKDHIDLSYRATNNKDTMYRALHITDLTPEFSGNYTCKVSGPESEDEVTKSMIIYGKLLYNIVVYFLIKSAFYVKNDIFLETK